MGKNKLDISDKDDFVGQYLASPFPRVVTPGCNQFGGDVGAPLTKDFTNVSELLESDLSSYVGDFVKCIPDMLIPDVFISNIICCNFQDSTNTTM